MDAEYTKRELDDHFKNVDARFDKQDALLVDLNKKVGIQNGRTAKLEGKANSVVLAGSVAFVLVGVIGSLIVYSFRISQENLKNEILLQVRNK